MRRSGKLKRAINDFFGVCSISIDDALRCVVDGDAPGSMVGRCGERLTVLGAGKTDSRPVLLVVAEF